MTEHLCPNNPEGKRWVEGHTRTCPHHTRLPQHTRSVRWGRRARARMDRETGTVGVQQPWGIDG